MYLNSIDVSDSINLRLWHWLLFPRFVYSSAELGSPRQVTVVLMSTRLNNSHGDIVTTLGGDSGYPHSNFLMLQGVYCISLTQDLSEISTPGN